MGTNTKVICSRSKIDAIADAIRERNEVQTTFTLDSMAPAVSNLNNKYIVVFSGATPNATITITDGTHTYTAESDANGDGAAVVHFEGTYSAIDSSASITRQTTLVNTQTVIFSRLPHEYREVEYIESKGVAYINTGVYLTSNHSVEIDYQFMAATQSRKGLFGGLNSGMTCRFGSLISPTGNAYEHGYGLNNTYWQQGVVDLDRHLLYQNKNLTYLDGRLIHTFNTATFTMTDVAYLCNFNYTNYNASLCKYYGSRWWNGDTLIREFVPCYRKSDNVTGMYDLVNNQFYSSVNSTNFVAGPDV